MSFGFRSVFRVLFGSELQKKTADVSFTDLTGVIVTWKKKVTGQRMLILGGRIEGGSVE